MPLISGLSRLSVLPPRPQDFTSGLIGWWPFIGGALSDHSGFGSATTGNGAYTPGIGLPGPCITSSAVNTVTISPSAQLATTPAISVACWVNMSSLANSYTALVKIIAGSLVNSVGLYVKSNGQQAIYIQTGASTTVDLDGIGPTMSTGVWYHLVATYDSVNGILYYANGNFFTNTAASGTIYYGGSAVTLGLGYDPNTASRQLSGSIADVRIYSRSLTRAEVFQLFSQSIAFPIGIGEGEMPALLKRTLVPYSGLKTYIRR